MTNSDPRHSTDQSLLNGIRTGSESAATEVFARYSPKLLSVARTRLSAMLSSRVDPDDIVQSTFKSFFRRASHGSYVAPESGDLFNLLIVIAMRKVNAKSEFHQAAIRDVRRSKRMDHLSQTWQGDEQPLRELCLTIEEICEGLSETQKTIIALRLEGYTVDEVAGKSDRSKRTVERELQNFRKSLSRYFDP